MESVSQLAENVRRVVAIFSAFVALNKSGIRLI
jgi:hypothetical protein